MLRLKGEEIDIGHWEGLERHLGNVLVKDRFLTEEDCEQALFQANWELGYRCPKCGFEDGIWTLKTRGLYQCPRCRHQYSAKSASRLYRKRASLLGCFKGAEWLILNLAREAYYRNTIEAFADVVGLSYRPARTLRLEMFEELKKPMGGFWGKLICDEVDEKAYAGDRWKDLMEYYGFEEKEPASALFKA